MKVLLWVVSNDGNFLNGAINVLESQHNDVELVGVTAGAEISLYKDGKIVTFIPPDKVDRGGVNIILVVGARLIGWGKIVQIARQINLPEEKLLGDWIVCIPGFTLKKYRKLQRSRLSIFSLNCCGGLLSNLLGLKFNSPIVNMFFDEKDYLRFLRAPRVYMEENLILKETAWQPALGGFDYPIFTLGNVDVHMNHYPDFDEAVAKWVARKARINWYNLFVTMYTSDEKILEEFDALPYGKKVCFVPFKSDLDSAWYLNPDLEKGSDFWLIVNHTCAGNPVCYDPFDMLLYGKKTQVIDM